MREKIVAQNLKHLNEIISEEINTNGHLCDLNHIDVSNVKRMDGLFSNSPFEGDISEWDVSKVIYMNFMFYGSPFNGDISKWDVSKVKSMDGMFKNSNFKKDLSDWDVSNVKKMSGMLSNCKKDLPIPYWAHYEDYTERQKAVKSYLLKKELEKDLPEVKNNNKKMKV